MITSGSAAVQYAEGCRFDPDLGRYFFVLVFHPLPLPTLSNAIPLKKYFTHSVSKDLFL